MCSARTDPQALIDRLVAPAALAANMAAGRPIFEKGVHAVPPLRRARPDVGSDQTALNTWLKKKEILKALLWASRIVADQFLSRILETRTERAAAASS